MRHSIPFCPKALSLIALSVLNTANAEETALSLPATDVTSTATYGDTGNPQGYQGKPSSTTTRLDLTNQETPQGVTNIKREQMDDFKLNSIRDVLTSTPGVNVQKVETDRTYFTARGFDINNFQYDGTAMPMTNGLLVGDIDLAPTNRSISCTAPTA
ncbi:TonB-dependent receptor plug domain-containing protein [Pseudomonas graminis]|uniref:TonB-dependent receptor plug domain-containing protein n=1 Tax=Pseudomonas graminis TaxID=158627 RepID=UPI003C155DCB